LDSSSFDERMPLGEHIDELRTHLIRSLLGLAVSVILCMFFSKYLLEFMAEPIIRVMVALEHEVPRLQEIRPGEYFFSLLKVGFLAGLIIASPFIFYEFWQFVKIGLLEHERRFVLIFGPLIVLSFIVGCIFTYLVALPMGLHFLMKMSPDEWVLSQWALSAYIDVFLGLTIAMGTVFELPLVMLFISRMGLVDWRWFAKYRRHAYFGSFVVAMFITPPDPFTQIMLALPMMLLYEFGIQLSKIRIRDWIQPGKNKNTEDQ